MGVSGSIKLNMASSYIHIVSGIWVINGNGMKNKIYVKPCKSKLLCVKLIFCFFLAYLMSGLSVVNILSPPRGSVELHTELKFQAIVNSGSRFYRR